MSADRRTMDSLARKVFAVIMAECVAIPTVVDSFDSNGRNHERKSKKKHKMKVGKKEKKASEEDVRHSIISETPKLVAEGTVRVCGDDDSDPDAGHRFFIQVSSDSDLDVAESCMTQNSDEPAVGSKEGSSALGDVDGFKEDKGGTLSEQNESKFIDNDVVISGVAESEKSELEKERRDGERKEKERREAEAAEAFLPMFLDWAKQCSPFRSRTGLLESSDISLPQSDEAAIASFVEIYSHAGLITTLRRAAISLSLRASRSRLDFLRISSPSWALLVSSCKYDGSVAWLTAELRALCARALRHKFVTFGDTEPLLPSRASSVSDDLVQAASSSPPGMVMSARRNSRPLLSHNSHGAAASVNATRHVQNPQQQHQHSPMRSNSVIVDQVLMKRASRRLLKEIGNRLAATESNGFDPIRGLVEVHAQLLSSTESVYGSTESLSRMLVASFFFLRILCPLLVSAAEWLPTQEDGIRQERVREMQLISRYVIKRATDNLASEDDQEAAPEELDKYDRRSSQEIARVCNILDRAAQHQSTGRPQNSADGIPATAGSGGGAKSIDPDHADPKIIAVSCDGEGLKRDCEGVISRDSGTLCHSRLPSAEPLRPEHAAIMLSLLSNYSAESPCVSSLPPELRGSWHALRNLQERYSNGVLSTRANLEVAFVEYDSTSSSDRGSSSFSGGVGTGDSSGTEVRIGGNATLSRSGSERLLQLRKISQYSDHDSIAATRRSSIQPRLPAHGGDDSSESDSSSSSQRQREMRKSLSESESSDRLLRSHERSRSSKHKR